jgi:23S rRNA (guanosine2251-2'-O)-methyltransferase
MGAIIYGIHAVKSALNYADDVLESSSSSGSSSSPVTVIWVDRARKDTRIHALIELAKKKSVKINYVQRKKLDELISGKHQGIVAESHAPKVNNESFLDELLQDLSEPLFLLVLDGIQDPHNLGACMRTADAAGIHAILAPKDRAASITPTVRKVASGADQTTPFIQVTNISRTLKLLKSYNIWIIGTCGDADATIYNTDLTGSIALVMGAEGTGMRQLTKKHCDLLVKIPMAGSVGSLNVSVATGIGLFEAVRQRRNVKR